MNFVHVLDKRVTEIHLCSFHGYEHVALHQQKFGDPTGLQRRSTGQGAAIECVTHFLFSYPSHDPPYGYVELFEKDGHRVFGLVIDLFVCDALYRALCKIPSPRPLTYDSILEIMATLGGHLQYVSIYQVVAENAVYGATTHILQDGEELTVDMRVSDALVLAIFNQKPVFVPEDLLVEG